MSVQTRLENRETFKFEELDTDYWEYTELGLFQIIEGTQTGVSLSCTFTETGDIVIDWPNGIQKTYTEEKLYWNS